MNASELRDKVAEHCGLKKVDVNKTLDSLAAVVRTELLGSNTDVALLGLGKLRSVAVPPHRIYDGLGTKQFMDLPAKRKIRFTPSADMKRSLAA